MSTLNLKEVQHILLEMVKDLDQLCRKHHITYWIDGGTYLGAVRNQGFIPWDDDIDLNFPVEDYHKALQVIREELIPQKSYYMLYNDARPFAHYSDFLCDTRYVRDYIYPIRIDLIKMKAIPNTPQAIQLDREYVNSIAFLFNKSYKGDSFSKSQLFKEHVLSGFFLFKCERFQNQFNHYVDQQKEVKEDKLYTYSFNDIYSNRERDYFRYDTIFPIKEIEFEGEMLPVPNDANKYLGLLYGENYMTPPPQNERIPFHTNYRKSIMPRFVVKHRLWVIYLLKAVKNSFWVIPRIRKLNR